MCAAEILAQIPASPKGMSGRRIDKRRGDLHRGMNLCKATFGEGAMGEVFVCQTDRPRQTQSSTVLRRARPVDRRRCNGSTRIRRFISSTSTMFTFLSAVRATQHIAHILFPGTHFRKYRTQIPDCTRRCIRIQDSYLLPETEVHDLLRWAQNLLYRDWAESHTHEPLNSL